MFWAGAQYGGVTAEKPDRSRAKDPRTGADAVRARIQQQSSWVDLQIRQAVDRGDFDQLPGYGKPLTNLTGDRDPDWWVKQLIEREQITGVLPPSLQVRKEDAELDGRLDRLATEKQVRREVEEFNARVRWALYRPPEGPPVVTRPRDVDHEVQQWLARRAASRQKAAERTKGGDTLAPSSAAGSGTGSGPGSGTGSGPGSDPVSGPGSGAVGTGPGAGRA